MSPLFRRIRQLYLAWFSTPASDRTYYRLIRKHRIRKVLEMGIGTAQRAGRLIETARQTHPDGQVTYTAIDLFEARSATDGPGIALKAAHRRLASSGARVRLVPGDPWTALARTANGLGTYDLIIISADQPRDQLARAWFYLPRLLADGALVFIEQRSGPGGAVLTAPVARVDVERLAALAAPRRAA